MEFSDKTVKNEGYQEEKTGSIRSFNQGNVYLNEKNIPDNLEA